MAETAATASCNLPHHAALRPMTVSRPPFGLAPALLAGSVGGLAHVGLLALGGAAGGDVRPWGLAAIAGLAAAIEAGCAAGIQADHRPLPASHDRVYGALSAAGALLFLLLTAGPLADWPRFSTRLTLGPGWIGLALALSLVGIVLRALAIRRLGARFSSGNVVDGRAGLETAGGDRLLAHPSEAGLLLLAAGAALLSASPWSLVVLGALYGSALARIGLEEATLRDRHGCIYKMYRADRFDPFPSWVRDR
jgi:protein-S-isoprenylcysteine O-methyltransferase Ste14